MCNSILCAKLSNEAKGIRSLNTFVLGKVQNDTRLKDLTPTTKFKPINVRLLWTDFISCVIGARGPFSRPRNMENMSDLIDKACSLFPRGIPRQSEKWAATTPNFHQDAEDLLTLTMVSTKSSFSTNGIITFSTFPVISIKFSQNYTTAR